MHRQELLGSYLLFTIIVSIVTKEAEGHRRRMYISVVHKGGDVCRSVHTCAYACSRKKGNQSMNRRLLL